MRHRDALFFEDLPAWERPFCILRQQRNQPSKHLLFNTDHAPDPLLTIGTETMLCQVCLNGLEGFRDPSKVKRVGYSDENETPVLTSDQDEIAKAVASPRVNVTRSTYNGMKLYHLSSEVEMYAFAHHLTKTSWLQAKSEGCEICRQIDCDEQVGDTADDDGHGSTFSNPGFFTTFVVKLEKARHDEGDTFIMVVWQGAQSSSTRWKSCVDGKTEESAGVY